MHQDQPDTTCVVQYQDQYLNEVKYSVTKQELQDLINGKWLTNSIINAYITFFQKFCISSKLQIWITNSAFYVEKFTHFDHIDNKLNNLWTNCPGFQEASIIIFPLHVSGNHWSLVVAYLIEQKVVYFDSKYGESRYFNKSCLKWTVVFCQKLVEKYHKLPPNTSWEISVANVPQQIGDRDCGVFTILNAFFVIKASRLTFFPKDIKYTREQIATDLLSNNFSGLPELFYHVPTSYTNSIPSTTQLDILFRTMFRSTRNLSDTMAISPTATTNTTTILTPIMPVTNINLEKLTIPK